MASIGYMNGGFDFNSNKTLANKVISEKCERIKIIHMANLSENPFININLNATTGPLKVASYIGAGDRKLNTTADVFAGVVFIDQLINLTKAYQNSKGVIGGPNFETVIANPDGTKKGAYTTIGCGNLIELSQLASWEDAIYRAEYEYMPVSYQTGTYDMNLNSSEIERD